MCGDVAMWTERSSRSLEGETKRNGGGGSEERDEEEGWGRDGVCWKVVKKIDEVCEGMY